MRKGKDGSIKEGKKGGERRICDSSVLSLAFPLPSLAFPCLNFHLISFTFSLLSFSISFPYLSFLFISFVIFSFSLPFSPFLSLLSYLSSNSPFDPPSFLLFCFFHLPFNFSFHLFFLHVLSFHFSFFPFLSLPFPSLPAPFFSFLLIPFFSMRSLYFILLSFLSIYPFPFPLPPASVRCSWVLS